LAYLPEPGGTAMRHTILIALFTILSCAVSSKAQSLGDTARQHEQTKSQHSDSKSTASQSRKVYTNDDLATKSGSVDTSSDEKKEEKNEEKKALKSKSHTTEAAAEEESKAKLSSEGWKTKIKEQKDAITAIQERIDKLEASINYVQNNRNIYVNAPEYNAAQDRKQRQVQYLKSELEERKSVLKDLQEEARQQGFGSAVYQ
jgi:hypothetical protein